MKSTISITTIFFLLITGYSCTATPDKDIVNILKDRRFQFEMFELSMCAEEILEILEKDTAQHRVWKQRLERVYDQKRTDYEKYLHSVELKFLLKQCEYLKGMYPLGYSFFLKSVPVDSPKSFEDLSLPFNHYIQYPEDIDPACLLVLVCFPDNKLSDIEKNKSSLKRFNNWIEYGYAEFRDPFSNNNIALRKINNRIIDFIIKTHEKSAQELAIKSVAMLKQMRK